MHTNCADYEQQLFSFFWIQDKFISTLYHIALLNTTWAIMSQCILIVSLYPAYMDQFLDLILFDICHKSKLGFRESKPYPLSISSTNNQNNKKVIVFFLRNGRATTRMNTFDIMILASVHCRCQAVLKQRCDDWPEGSFLDTFMFTLGTLWHRIIYCFAVESQLYDLFFLFHAH